MNIEKEKTLKALNNTFDKFIDYINNDIEHVSIDDFNPNETMLVIIDMVNGFVREGVLSSPFVDAISKPLSELAVKCKEKNIPIIAYADTHGESCKEFNSFPPHCIRGTSEAELIDELKDIKDIIKVEKNSTNSFLAKNPLELVDKNIKNIIVVGCVTDICVRDFAKTMNKYIDDKNLDSKVYVVENLVDTYEIPNVHSRELEHLLAIYDMKTAGIQIIRIN